MNTSLCFSLWYPLHTVNTRFILQNTIHSVACNIKYYFLETTCSSLRCVGYLHLPVFGLTILYIHSEELAGKQTAFITPGTGPDFNNSILGIFRIGGQKQNFDFLFQSRKSFFHFIKLFLCHITHLLVLLLLENLLCILNILQKILVFLGYLYQFFQFLVLFVELYISLVIRYNLWVGNLSTNFLETKPDNFKLI